MAVSRNLILDWNCYSAAAVAPGIFIPAGGWLLTAGVTGARAWGEMRGRVANFQAQPSVQVANDTRVPGAATALGALILADGVFDPIAAAAITNSATSRYLRPGWLVSLAPGGGALATANLYCIIELQY